MSRVPGTYTGARVWQGPIPGTHEPGFVEQPIMQRPLPPSLLSTPHIELHGFTMGECAIMLALEPAPGPRWHLSISCLDRHPTWDEIKVARYRLMGPNLTAVMVLPPPDEYVNVPAQDHTFHVWEQAR